jgi:hypothetical protein
VPEDGRTARVILRHVLQTPGAYLSAVLGGISGFSRITSAVDKGGLALPEALLDVGSLAEQRVRETTPEQRSAVIRRPKELRTLRKVIRRMLEHDWEHLAELSRRPGGPSL